MIEQKNKREYTVPMARMIGARMAKGQIPESICFPGGHPHSPICSPIGYSPAQDTCAVGSNVGVFCLAGSVPIQT
jgi:hypothetical protein